MPTSYSNLFGTNGSGDENRIGSLFGQASTQSGAGQQPQQQQQQPQQTFQQMQQAGQARPAPPQQAQQAYGGMMERLLGQLNQPTGYNTQQLQQMRSAQMANLNQQFSQQQQQLEENLARRGLSASTIGAAGIGRLAGEQSRAMADVESRLLQQQAEMEQRSRESNINALTNITGQLGQLGLGGRELDVRERQFEETLNADERRFARTLEEQRAARLQQFGLSSRELDQQARRLQQEAALQGRTLDLQQARDAAEVDYRARQLQQQESQFGRTLSADEARQRAQLAFDREQLAQDAELRRLGFTVTREELAQRQQQFTQDLALRGELGRGQLEQEQQRFRLQLAAALAALRPEQIAAFRAQMGTGFPLTPPPTTTGGGMPYPTGGMGTGTGTGNEIIPGSSDIPMTAYDTSLSTLLSNMYGF